ncbi:DoxX family protein [Rhodovastum atsumiense]|uniref:DoxX family protein n=2 Tax=Rhodovastum atsumiense TaxID=504468 RepID=A0A5M6IT31_9PROT|nr:DoxX family protein [Rhodovastum atsumiense]
MAGGDAGRPVPALYDRTAALARMIVPPAAAQLLLRLALAVPFWRSGLLKWDGFLRLGDTAVLLFTEEFRLHLPGGPYPLPAPALMAFLAGTVEIAAPVLLVLGLGTRLAALALLLMTGVVQLVVPDGWPVHLTWAALALGLIVWGPGGLSCDALLRRCLPGGRSPRRPD